MKQASLVVGVAAATTFCTALAAVVGLVPRAGGATSVHTAAAAAVAAPTWIDQDAPGVPESIPEAAPTTVTSADRVTVTSTTVAPTTAIHAAPAVVEAEVVPAPSAPVEAEAAPAGPVAPAAPAAPPRRVPSPAEVQQAIRGMERFVTFKNGLFDLLADVPTPTVEQVNDLANKACTAFDEGQSLAQVTATGLAMAADNPWVTISQAGADYVVRTAVELYCPGHADKLS